MRNKSLERDHALLEGAQPGARVYLIECDQLLKVRDGIRQALGRDDHFPLVLTPRLPFWP